MVGDTLLADYIEQEVIRRGRCLLLLLPGINGERVFLSGYRLKKVRGLFIVVCNIAYAKGQMRDTVLYF